MAKNTSDTLHFFFNPDAGIRDAQESRGLGDVYKRQVQYSGSKKVHNAPHQPSPLYLLITQ